MQVEQPDMVSSGQWGRAAMVFGLTGVAITQPVLDLFGRNPEFFVAGHYGTTTIVLFALVVAVVPGSVVAGVLLIADRLHPQLGRWLHLLVLAALGALLANVVARGVGVDRMLVAAGASVLGAGFALALNRLPPGRLLLKYLAIGNVLFVFAFAITSPTSALVIGSPHGGDRGSVQVPDIAGPIVVVILDELPVTTLMKSDGTINEQRFPNFAELASSSTWFRNASGHASLTHYAVPELLTGNLVTQGTLPTYGEHPRNLFTLLGGTVRVRRHEVVTEMCPPDICEQPPRQPLWRALGDAAVVFAHRALPARLRVGLPSIDHSWGGFTGDLMGPAAPGSTSPAESTVASGLGRGDLGSQPQASSEAWQLTTGQVAILNESSAEISPAPALHYVHVQLPHYPWILTPWGTRLFDYPSRDDNPGDPAYDWDSRQQYQLQSMQTGAADVAIGRLIRHMKAVGAWDAATVVVVSDHGVSLLPPDFGRLRTPATEQELFRVPLFIKAPGQTKGALVDDPAQSIDLLPSLIDLLGIKTDWKFDGHSLFDGTEPTVEPLVGRSFAPALEVVRRHLAQIPGLDWVGLAAVGEHAELVGRHLDDFPLGAPSRITWTPDHEADFASLPTAAGAAPQLLTGTVRVPFGDPPELIVAVNGMIGGTTGGYQRGADGWTFTSYLGPYLRQGANEIRAFLVGSGPNGPVLHEVH